MKVTKKKAGNRLTVFIEGKLDAENSQQFEAELGDITGVEDLIFDLKDMKYVSSAGLRVILNAQKVMDEQGNMTVRNVNDEVMNILHETGFDKILDIVD